MSKGNFALLAVAGVLAVAGGVWGRGYIQSRPQNVVPVALAKLAGADSVGVEASLLINLPESMRGGSKRPFTKVDVTFDGAIKSGESGGSAVGYFKTQAEGRGNILFADGEARILPGETIFKLENMPLLLDSRGKLAGKWTRTDAVLLKSNEGFNTKQLLDVMYPALARADIGRDGDDIVLRTSLSEEEETALANIARSESSGNEAANVVARLLAANKVEYVEVTIDAGAREVKGIQAHFVRPRENKDPFDFARLALEFSDYNKQVEVERPVTQAVVKPGVFAKLFGGESANIAAGDVMVASEVQKSEN